MALFVFWFFGGFKFISKIKKRKRVQARLSENKDAERIQSLTAALDSGDLSRFHELVSKADLQQLSIMEPLCAGYLKQLTEYVQKYPDQANALLLLGMAQTDVAWKLRSGATGQNLTEDQVSDFMFYLDMAEENLARVMELDPKQPLLYPVFIRVKKGLSLRQQAYRLYTNATDNGALTYRAAREMVSLLSERWLGEPGEMLKFAQEQLSAHSQLPGMYAIMLDAYIERDIETREKKFFKKSEVSQALTQAEAEAGKTSHPDYLGKSNHYAALNSLALIHIERGEKKKAKNVFNEILNHFEPHPWKYRHSDPNKIFMDYAMMFA
jgi:hypothetical protein